MLNPSAGQLQGVSAVTPPLCILYPAYYAVPVMMNDITIKSRLVKKRQARITI